MTDIVERLRDGCGCNYPETTCMAESECADAFAAADEIERLRAALREIAKTTYGYEPYMTDEEAAEYFKWRFFAAQDTARAALKEDGDD